MLEWDDYSIHDLVNLDQPDEHVKYMTKTLTAFKAVEQFYVRKKEQDHEALAEYEIVLSYLKKLYYTFELLRLKYLFSTSDSLRIDKKDSGFVNFYEISQIETDLASPIDTAALAKERQVLKEQIVSYLLTKHKDPEKLLGKMAGNTYRSGLDKDKLFLFFNEGELSLRDNQPGKLRSYFYHWACYDKKSNMPYIYMLDFEQDSKVEALHENDEAFADFMKVVRSEGSRAPAAGIVAMAMDQRLKHIHPKMLKRICIGPLYSHSFSVDLPEEIQRVFAVGDEGRRFIFHLTEQFVFSIGQTVIKDQNILGGILKGKSVRERFYTPKPDDVEGYAIFNELEEQKASFIRKSVVMPYKLHQHVKDLYRDYKIISFTRDGSINGV